MSSPPSSDRPARPNRPSPPDPSAPQVRVAPARKRSRYRQWPILLVVAGLVGSLGVVAADHFRRGTYLLAGTVLLAALLRLALPTRKAGLLAVRGRFTDVLILGGLGGGMLLLAWLVPKPS
jgi:hypothetical protein